MKKNRAWAEFKTLGKAHKTLTGIRELTVKS